MYRACLSSKRPTEPLSPVPTDCTPLFGPVVETLPSPLTDRDSGLLNLIGGRDFGFEEDPPKADPTTLFTTLPAICENSFSNIELFPYIYIYYIVLYYINPN